MHRKLSSKSYMDLIADSGLFGRFDLAALCGCRTLNFCLFVLFILLVLAGVSGAGRLSGL